MNQGLASARCALDAGDMAGTLLPREASLLTMGYHRLMAMLVIRTGMRLAVILDNVATLQYAHQVGREDHEEVVSLLWEVGPSEGPLQRL